MITALAWLFTNMNKTKDEVGYSVVEKGKENTFDYRLFIKYNSQVISIFHDIPLYCDNTPEGVADPIFHAVIEIPRWTNAKMEIDKNSPMNPLKQDIKKEALRFVDNIFPHKGYPWNYGAFSQTWEDPRQADHNTGFAGDNDPLDICEIGNSVLKRGSVVRVKVLGAIALIDEGETDWKIIVINEEDPLASKLNDVEDINKSMPGYLTEMREWFRNYKIPQGKPPNEFAFGGEFKNKKFALQIITECHENWKSLINQKDSVEGICLKNVTVESSPHLIDGKEASKYPHECSAFQQKESSALNKQEEQWNFIE